MKYQLIGYGDDLPDWATSVQAQLAALEAGPRKRWRLFRRCDVICERCREQLCQVMNTTPPVVVTRQHVRSAEHPHTRDVARTVDELLRTGDRRSAPLTELHADDEDHWTAATPEQLSGRVDADIHASRLARVSSTRSWWLPLDMIPEHSGEMVVPFELSCKCRRVPIWRAHFLAMIDGRTQLLM